MVNITVYGDKYFITLTEAIKAYAVQKLLKINRYNQSSFEILKKDIEKPFITNRYAVIKTTPKNN